MPRKTQDVYVYAAAEYLRLVELGRVRADVAEHLARVLQRGGPE